MRGFLAAGLAMFASVEATAQAPRFSTEGLSRHVEALASPSFEGRAPGTEGERRTIDYIVQAFHDAGLQPGAEQGHDGKRGWLQKVPIEEFTIEGTPRLLMHLGGASRSLTQQKDIALASRSEAKRLAIKDAPLVFVGFGIDAPEKRWDDFKGIDLHGKIALVLINDPDHDRDMGGRFAGPTMTYYGRWDYKLAELSRQGALGVLIIHEQPAALADWDGMAHFFTLPQLDLQRSARTLRNCEIEGWITAELARDIFRSAGRDYDSDKRSAASPDFRPVTLRNTSFSASFELRHRTFESHNVVGRIEGGKRSDEAVILSAHWDHLGIADPDASGDTVYHGAQDNAAGVAGLIELARVLAKEPRSPRTITFLALTGEEKGLLGASYYALHPATRLDRTVADINLDAPDMKGPTHDISLWGIGKSSLESEVAEMAQHAGRHFAINPRFSAGYYFRADHFAFARAGVPAVTFGSGIDLIEGGPKAGKAAEADYYDHIYHTPADRWSKQLDFSGFASDLELVADLARNLSGDMPFPTFASDSDYRTAQDRLRRRPTAAQP